METFISLLPKLLSGIGVFSLFAIGSWIAKRVTDNFLISVPTIQKLSGNIVRTVVVLIGLMAALGTMGIDLSAMWASLGITGFAVGIALKELVSNALSGLSILLYQPFKIGDDIKINGESGKVVLIDLRYTTLVFRNDVILVPNSQLLSNILKIENGKDNLEIKIQNIKEQNEISSIGETNSRTSG